MLTNYWLISPILFPIIAGLALLFTARLEIGKTIRHIWVMVSVIIELLLIGCCLYTGGALEAWHLTEDIAIVFRTDACSAIFASLAGIMWICVALYSFEYMSHDKNENFFFGFFLISEAMLIACSFAANIITFYISFEFMTLMTVPLVLHEMTHEAIMAGLKYLFYSIAGAFMVLLGIIFTSGYGSLGMFVNGGGIINDLILVERPGSFYAGVLLFIVGFGTKAGMFPMHGWLPTAHPEAPAPASALLSGIITKMGVLGVIRVVFYVVGTQYLMNSWVRTVWMVLSLITVFMGSMLAYKEPVLKRRLAYSTVSQVSYIMFGLSTLNRIAFVGAIMHVIFHSFAKTTLFLGAGSIIHQTGKTRIDELRGIGKEMPVVIWCFTLASISLIGIPPASGFISKWMLAKGSLIANIPVFGWLGPVILLISALLTAGYLLPVTIKGFFPGKDFDYGKLCKKEPTFRMLIPLIILTFGIMIFGIFPNPLRDVLMTLATSLV